MKAGSRPQPDPAWRPSRLPLVIHLLVFLLLGTSFVSGILVWRGQFLQQELLETPDWLRPMLLLHGITNPLVCVLFGVLLGQHIRWGWALRANWISGLPLELTLAGLILTGLGLYYAGTESWRTTMIWAHRVLGLALPVTLTAHWICARIWVKNNTK